MSTLTPRGRTALVLAFFASATLCAGAAVALVKASDSTSSAARPLPTGQPSAQPTDTPSPAATPTPTPQVTASPAASATAVATRTPVATHSPVRTTRSPAPAGSAEPVPSNVPGLTVKATLDPAAGDTTTQTVFHVTAHATDQAGTIGDGTVDWGDGQSQALSSTSCSTDPATDCQDFTDVGHTYAAGTYTVTVTITATDHTASSVFKVVVKAASN